MTDQKTQTTLEEALAERNAKLTALDMDWAREQMPNASSDKVRLCAMHKARYECTALDRDVRIASYKYLKLRHYKRMTGDDLLPYGELPE